MKEIIERDIESRELMRQGFNRHDCPFRAIPEQPLLSGRGCSRLCVHQEIPKFIGSRAHRPYRDNNRLTSK
jgi:hypothetical protein